MGLGQRVDDAPKQDRLGELRQRERNIGDGKRPAQSRLRSEQSQHARIKVENWHAPMCAGTDPSGNRELVLCQAKLRSRQLLDDPHDYKQDHRADESKQDCADHAAAQRER